MFKRITTIFLSIAMILCMMPNSVLISNAKSVCLASVTNNPTKLDYSNDDCHFEGEYFVYDINPNGLELNLTDADGVTHNWTCDGDSLGYYEGPNNTGIWLFIGPDGWTRKGNIEVKVDWVADYDNEDSEIMASTSYFVNVDRDTPMLEVAEAPKTDYSRADVYKDEDSGQMKCHLDVSGLKLEFNNLDYNSWTCTGKEEGLYKLSDGKGIYIHLDDVNNEDQCCDVQVDLLEDGNDKESNVLASTSYSINISSDFEIINNPELTKYFYNVTGHFDDEDGYFHYDLNPKGLSVSMGGQGSDSEKTWTCTENKMGLYKLDDGTGIYLQPQTEEFGLGTYDINVKWITDGDDEESDVIAETSYPISIVNATLDISVKPEKVNYIYGEDGSVKDGYFYYDFNPNGMKFTMNRGEETTWICDKTAEGLYKLSDGTGIYIHSEQEEEWEEGEHFIDIDWVEDGEDENSEVLASATQKINVIIPTIEILNAPHKTFYKYNIDGETKNNYFKYNINPDGLKVELQKGDTSNQKNISLTKEGVYALDDGSGIYVHSTQSNYWAVGTYEVKVDWIKDKNNINSFVLASNTYDIKVINLICLTSPATTQYYYDENQNYDINPNGLTLYFSNGTTGFSWICNGKSLGKYEMEDGSGIILSKGNLSMGQNEISIKWIADYNDDNSEVLSTSSYDIDVIKQNTYDAAITKNPNILKYYETEDTGKNPVIDPTGLKLDFTYDTNSDNGTIGFTCNKFNDSNVYKINNTYSVKITAKNNNKDWSIGTNKIYVQIVDTDDNSKVYTETSYNVELRSKDSKIFDIVKLPDRTEYFTNYDNTKDSSVYVVNPYGLKLSLDEGNGLMESWTCDKTSSGTYNLDDGTKINISNIKDISTANPYFSITRLNDAEETLDTKQVPVTISNRTNIHIVNGPTKNTYTEYIDSSSENDKEVYNINPNGLKLEIVLKDGSTTNWTCDASVPGIFNIDNKYTVEIDPNNDIKDWGVGTNNLCVVIKDYNTHDIIDALYTPITTVGSEYSNISKGDIVRNYAQSQQLIASLQSQISNAQAQLNDKITELNSTKATLQNKITELNTAKSELATASENLTQKTNALNTSEEEKNNLQSQLSKVNAQLTDVTNELNQKKTELANVNSQLNDSENKYNELQTKYNNLLAQGSGGGSTTPIPTPTPTPGDEADVKEVAFAKFNASLSKYNFEFNGSAITPDVTLKDSAGKILTKDVDYTVAYDNNLNPGIAKITITGKGAYVGTKELQFEIIDNSKAEQLQATITGVNNIDIIKLKSYASKGKIKLSWGRTASNYKITGYKILRSTNKYSGYKTIITTKNRYATNSKGLIKGKTYYYKVKGYRIINGKTVYTGCDRISVKAK